MRTRVKTNYYKKYDRTELDHVHYTAATSINTPPKVFSGIKTSYPCFRNCQIFLLCGAFFIEGQGRLADTSCSYLVKDEESIGFCGSKTVIVILEEGEQRGVCRRHTQEWQEKLRAKESKSKSSIECSIM